MKNILSKTREVLFNVFGSYISDDPKVAKRIIKEATFTGKTDPGGWSPSAAVIIHLESGIPSGMYDHRIDEKWYEVSQQLGTHFVEPINGAVSGVYEA